MGFNEKLWADTKSNTEDIAKISFSDFPKIVALGDSITNQNGLWGSSSRYYLPIGYLAWLNWYSNGQFNVVLSDGVIGDTTAQILTRFNSAMSYDSDIFIVEGGVNDVFATGPTISSSTTIANLKSMYDSVLSYGRILVVTTVTPAAGVNTDEEFLKLCEINNFIREYSKQNKNTILVDWFETVSDGDCRYFYSQYTDDGTHQNILGAKKMGKALYDALKYKLKYGASVIIPEKSNPNNKLLNNSFDSLDNVNATSWEYTGNPTKSIVEYDTGKSIINEQLLTQTVATDTYMRQDVTLTPGRKAIASVRVRTREITSVGTLRIQLAGDSSIYSMESSLGASGVALLLDEFVMTTPEFTVPASGNFAVFLTSSQLVGTVKWSSPTVRYLD